MATKLNPILAAALTASGADTGETKASTNGTRTASKASTKRKGWTDKQREEHAARMRKAWERRRKAGTATVRRRTKRTVAASAKPDADTAAEDARRAALVAREGKRARWGGTRLSAKRGKPAAKRSGAKAHGKRVELENPEITLTIVATIPLDITDRDSIDDSIEEALGALREYGTASVTRRVLTGVVRKG